MPRIHCPEPLSTGQALSLPSGAARHVQVLRMQPGHALTLFDGRGGEYVAQITRMSRQDVWVDVGAHDPVEREPSTIVHLAVGMPANERMDWLVEKAGELGVASIQPLMTAHSTLRLSGERAEKKRAHWQAIAISACEQCGRNRVPTIHPVQTLDAWLDGTQAQDQTRWVLSLADGSQPLHAAQGAAAASHVVLSGPEGGLNSSEEAKALAQGFRPASLGSRVLRAETAALAALIALTP